MRDLNGEEIRQGELATLLCEVIGVESNGVVVRICNSAVQLLIDARHDELAGGLVASSELAASVPRCQQCAVKLTAENLVMETNFCRGCFSSAHPVCQTS